jgi:hypothetical protein
LKSTVRDMQFAAIRLAGEWQQGKLIATLAEFAASEKDTALRGEALTALRLIGGGETVKALKKLVAEDQPADVRREALIPLAMHGRADAFAALPSILKQTTDQNVAQSLWRQLLQHAPFANQFASAVPKDLPPAAYADALQIAKGMGRGGNALVAALQPLVGAQAAPRDYPAAMPLAESAATTALISPASVPARPLITSSKARSIQQRK